MEQKTFTPYGSSPDMDELVDSNDAGKKLRAVEQHYGLDKLVSSESDVVRFTIAEQGFYHNILVNDPDPIVRAEVAQKGAKQYLDILVNDKKASVREAVADRGFEDHLEKLISDPDYMVREAVALQHYGLDVLINDPVQVVKDAAQTAINEDNELKMKIARGEELISQEIKKHPQGYNLYLSYDDKISEENFLTAYDNYKEEVEQAKKNGVAYEMSFENYLYEDVFERWDIYDRLIYEYDYFYDNLSDDDKEAVDAYLENEGYQTLDEAFQGTSAESISFAIDDVLPDLHINLMFATEEEQNQDMGSIAYTLVKDDIETFKGFSDYLQTQSPDAISRRFDNAMTYLVEQQGHSMVEIAERYYDTNSSDNSFISSLYNELINNTYDMCELTALVNVNDKKGLDVLEQIARGEGNIELSKDTMIGFFNEWNGSGSCLDIALEKPLILPASMVRNVQVEKAYYDRDTKGHGYSVDSVYGLIGRAWDGTMSKAPDDIQIPVLSQEHFTNVINEIKIAADKIVPEKNKIQDNSER